MKFLHRMNTPIEIKEKVKQLEDDFLKEDEVTDIVDDHDIIAPLNSSIKKETA